MLRPPLLAIAPLLALLVGCSSAAFAGQENPTASAGQQAAETTTAALAKVRQAADQGDAEAQNDLGVMYANGRAVPQDLMQSAAWFHRAASQGNAAAQNSVGAAYASGRGFYRDFAQAAAWFRKAADQGNADAQNNLGTMYANGRGVPQDLTQAAAWFRKAADQGHADAQRNLGTLYAKGRGVSQEPSDLVRGSERTVVLQDFDVAGAGFSFRQGELVQITDETRLGFVPGLDPKRPFASIDFFLDLPYGISTNNSSVTRDLNGKGGVRDVGEKSLAEVREAPTRGYKPTLKPGDIKDGHTYCFLAADGEHYAKLHVIKFDKAQGTLEFTWQYQPKATNKFE